MSLSVGIVGLPNVGKSTLFNALLKKQQAYVANFPFATIEPNIGVVPVPDSRLQKLAEVIESEILRYQDTKILEEKNSSHAVSKYPSIPIIPATVEFLDIAGLIAGAHKGEGLGNKFLAHIREVDAICHVVRAFSDPDVIRQGVANPKTDLEVVETELKLADLQTLEKTQNSKLLPGRQAGKAQSDNAKFKISAQEKLIEGISKGVPARNVDLAREEKEAAKEFHLLTMKPVLVVLNVDEEDLRNADEIEEKYSQETGLNKDQVIAICAKTESELAELSKEDQKTYLKDLGVGQSGLERLIKKAFSTLGLITFLTAGEKEVRAWTIRLGTTSLMASAVIHSDFEKSFIKADIVNFRDFINPGGLASPKPGEGGWKKCRELGKVRSEGKDYIMQDGDVVEFMIGR